MGRELRGNVTLYEGEFRFTQKRRPFASYSSENLEGKLCYFTLETEQEQH
jgi:hypothetical protein